MVVWGRIRLSIIGLGFNAFLGSFASATTVISETETRKTEKAHSIVQATCQNSTSRAGYYSCRISDVLKNARDPGEHLQVGQEFLVSTGRRLATTRKGVPVTSMIPGWPELDGVTAVFMLDKVSAWAGAVPVMMVRTLEAGVFRVETSAAGESVILKNKFESTSAQTLIGQHARSEGEKESLLQFKQRIRRHLSSRSGR